MNKNLIFIIGPQAVGKMAVGLELSQKTGYKFMHNHQTIDMLLNLFDFGSPSFLKLLMQFRMSIFEEFASSSNTGFIYSGIWDFSSESDILEFNAYSKPFRKNGAKVLFVELESPIEIRIKRNKTKLRLDNKPSKRNVDISEQRMLSSKYENYNSSGRFPYPDEHLLINNSTLTPSEVASIILKHIHINSLVNA